MAHEALWCRHENQVRWVSWQIVRRYGGDFDETFAEASAIFVEVVNSYDESKGSLSNWITFKVFRNLQEIKRHEAIRLRITGPVEAIHEKSNIAEALDSIEEFWKDLSPESQDVLSVLFNLEASSFRNKSLVKLLLRTTLKRQFGYSNDLIDFCFGEIEAALT